MLTGECLLEQKIYVESTREQNVLVGLVDEMQCVQFTVLKINKMQKWI